MRRRAGSRCRGPGRWCFLFGGEEAVSQAGGQTGGKRYVVELGARRRGGGRLPVCMLTNTLLALKATLSHKPETKQQARMGASECAGSISCRKVVVHPAAALGEAFSGGGVVSEDSWTDETRALRGAVGVSLLGAAAVSGPIVMRVFQKSCVFGPVGAPLLLLSPPRWCLLMMEARG